jgi:hypothetical protein
LLAAKRSIFDHLTDRKSKRAYVKNAQLTSGAIFSI